MGDRGEVALTNDSQIPTFPVHFAATPHKPFPPRDTLPLTEVPMASADDGLSGDVYAAAVQRYLNECGPFTAEGVNWARIVLDTKSDGQPRFVARVPIHGVGRVAALI